MSNKYSIQGKDAFLINEVCAMTGVKPYVLRFWESEFDEISPELNPSGEKLFSAKDLEAVGLIKKLLFVDKLTIDKAKFELRLHPSFNPVVNAGPDGLTIDEDFLSESFESGEQEVSLQDYSFVASQLKKIILKSETIQKTHNWF